jgi:hypothetical protein
MCNQKEIKKCSVLMYVKDKIEDQREKPIWSGKQACFGNGSSLSPIFNNKKKKIGRDGKKSKRGSGKIVNDGSGRQKNGT